MKQIINVKIERELSDAEFEYIRTLSDEQKVALINEHKEEVYVIFDDADILRSHFRELEIEFTDSTAIK